MEFYSETAKVFVIVFYLNLNDKITKSKYQAFLYHFFDLVKFLKEYMKKIFEDHTFFIAGDANFSEFCRNQYELIADKSPKGFEMVSYEGYLTFFFENMMLK